MIFRAIRPACQKDIEWIVFQEQRKDFKPFIHHWPAEEHERNLAAPDKLYLIAVDANMEPLAFVILAGLSTEARCIELVRMAVIQPGIGIGKPILEKVIHIAFTELGANRLWLDVFDDNSRARHTYKTVGFYEEGVLREAALKSNGQLGSLVIMSILAKEFNMEKKC
ncbi:MAG: GNAT family N-acetyltransferase [Desulfobacteraceae bacterium]